MFDRAIFAYAVVLPQTFDLRYAPECTLTLTHFYSNFILFKCPNICFKNSHKIHEIIAFDTKTPLYKVSISLRLLKKTG